MSKMRLNDENYIWAVRSVVKDFAKALGLDFSEKSLKSIDELAGFATWATKRFYDDSDRPDSKRVFAAMDEAIALLRDKQAPGLPPDEQYRAFKKILRDHRRDLFSGLRLLGNYTGEVAVRNLGGRWTVKRPLFGSEEYGVELNGTFYSEVALVVMEHASLSTFYTKMKAQAQGLSVNDIELSSTVPSGVGDD